MSLLPPRHERTPSPGAEDDDAEFERYVERSAKDAGLAAVSPAKRPRVAAEEEPHWRAAVDEELASSADDDPAPKPRTSAAAYRAFAAKRRFKSVAKIKLSVEEVDLARREVQELNDLVRTMQQELQGDEAVRLANDAVLWRYAQQWRSAPHGPPPKGTEAERLLQSGDGQDSTVTTIAPSLPSRSLWKAATRRRMNCFWPREPGNIEADALDEELESIVERRWRQAVREQLSLNKTERAASPPGPIEAVPPKRLSRTPESDAGSSPSSASSSSSSSRESHTGSSDHEHPINQPDESERDQIETPSALLDPILAATQTRLHRVLDLAPLQAHAGCRGEGAAPASSSRLDWMGMLCLLETSCRTQTRRAGHIATADQAILDRTRERLYAIYGAPEHSEERTSDSEPLLDTEQELFTGNYLDDIISGRFEPSAPRLRPRPLGRRGSVKAHKGA